MITNRHEPVLITGFHRSGTSAVARVLAMAGVDFGTNLLGATVGNPHGHFEDLDVVAAHDAALAAHNLTWASTTPCPRPRPTLDSFARSTLANSREAPWAIKDPRLCLFLADWLEHLSEPRVIVVLRRPGPAIESLHHRHVRRSVDTRRVDPTDTAFWSDPDLGLRLWLHYGNQLLGALSSLDAERILVADFDMREQLTDLPRRCNERWELGLTETVTTAIDNELGRFARDTAIEVRNTSLLDDAVELWAEIQSFRSDIAQDT